MHRWLGGVALIFTGVHVIALLADQYVHFGLAGVLVPFASKWHPVAVAWGVVALYLLLAVELTSLARARLPKKVWRRVHFASFALFIVSTIHGLAAGTDTKNAMAGVVAGVVASVFVGLTAARIIESVQVDTPTPRRAPVRQRLTTNH
jgi:predicted ferric reductase